METSRPPFEKYLFVCEHAREEGDFCGAPGVAVRETLKQAVKDAGLAGRVRVSRSGCLDVCAKGPNVLLYPDGVLYSHVTPSDIPTIVAALVHQLNGERS
ncbi:MAG: Ferredoxin, 2Fe-2S [Candidatus Omnitrophica bacterium]|nr:Ferredoxin, 2Fe-2S [Candidatus Omnitrophota bacterium]